MSVAEPIGDGDAALVLPNAQVTLNHSRRFENQSTIAHRWQRGHIGEQYPLLKNERGSRRRVYLTGTSMGGHVGTSGAVLLFAESPDCANVRFEPR